MRSLTWFKMLGVGAVMCIGGPALVFWVTPSEEEIIKRYNPELRKRALETREERQEDFNKFVNKLKGYSKQDKPIWTVWEEEGAKNIATANQAKIDAQRAAEAAANTRRDEIRSSIK